MGSARSLGVAVLFVCATGPASAAEVYDLQKGDKWRIGDVVTTAVEERDVQQLKFVEADGTSVPGPASDVVVKAKLIERCMAIDASGHRTRAFVYVEAWTADDGKIRDNSLAAAVLDVTGVGKDRIASVVSSRIELTKAASAWLGRRYGGGRPDLAAARGYWLPKVPVAVGDTWSADLAAFLDATAAGARLDRTKTASTCTLTSVEKSVAVVTCEARLSLAAFPGKEGGKPIPWKSGGTEFDKGTITMGLDVRIVPSTLAFTSVLEGEAELAGKSVSILIKKDRRSEMVVAGEWPATVKLPAPEAPPEPPADAGMDAMGN